MTVIPLDPGDRTGRGRRPVLEARNLTPHVGDIGTLIFICRASKKPCSSMCKTTPRTAKEPQRL